MIRSLSAVATLACLLVTTSTADAATVRGKLAKRGYTVIALAPSGETRSKPAPSGRFKLKTPGRVFTLQLRGPSGRYAGPIVVRQSQTSVVVGIKAGAVLGEITVRRGYAVPKHKLDAEYVAKRLRGRAKRGVPVGARNFGYVAGRSGARTAQAEDEAPGGDADADAVPNALDVDDDGDLELDNVDETHSQPAGETGFRNFSQMFLTIEETVNANAAAVDDAAIDAAMVDAGSLVLLNVAPQTELDCGGLSYCSQGGTGRLEKDPGGGPNNLGEPFPACCDDDGDGLGTMPLNDRDEFRLLPHAGHKAIGSGDTLIQRLADGSEFSGTIGFVFNTVPAVAAWSDGSGASGTFSYPAGDNAPGTAANPLPITKNGAGEYVLSLSIWRPQRTPIPGAGEGDGFVDIGGLAYEANMPAPPSAPPGGGPPGPPGPPAGVAQAGPPPPGGGQSPQCPASSLSTSDPDLTVTSDGPDIGQLEDAAADRPASVANTLEFTVNLSTCAAAKGYSLDPGGTLNFDVAATAVSRDHANQIVYLRLN